MMPNWNLTPLSFQKKEQKKFFQLLLHHKSIKSQFSSFSLTKINYFTYSFFFIVWTTGYISQKILPVKRARRSSSYEYRAFIHAYQDRCFAHIYYWLLRRASKIHRIQQLQFHYRALVASRRVSDSICTRMR